MLVPFSLKVTTVVFKITLGTVVTITTVPVLLFPVSETGLLSPPPVVKLLMAWSILSVLLFLSLIPSISPSTISVTNSAISAWDSAGEGDWPSSAAEFSPICDIAARTVPNLPASSLAAVVVLISVGMVRIISTESRPKAVATSAFLAIILLAKLVPANWKAISDRGDESIVTSPVPG